MPTFMSLAVLILGVQCSRGPQKEISYVEDAKQTVNNSAPLEIQSQDNNLKMDEETKRFLEESARNGIKKASLKLKLKNLSETTLGRETEMRFWVGFGLASTRCLILKTREGNDQALYIGPRVAGDKPVFDDKGEAIIDTITLGAPKSGWEEFEIFLKNQGIDSPLKLSLDKKHEPSTDGESIVVEVKSDDAYSMVFFSVHTESQDGQKALKVCRRIAEEFDVQIGC